MVVAIPFLRRITMKPPPPMFPAAGYVTASANAVATAASTALPPRRSTCAPTSDAIDELEMTSPRLDTIIPGESMALCARSVVETTEPAPRRSARDVRASMVMRRSDRQREGEDAAEYEP